MGSILQAQIIGTLNTIDLNDTLLTVNSGTGTLGTMSKGTWFKCIVAWWNGVSYDKTVVAQKINSVLQNTNFGRRSAIGNTLLKDRLEVLNLKFGNDQLGPTLQKIQTALDGQGPRRAPRRKQGIESVAVAAPQAVSESVIAAPPSKQKTYQEKNQQKLVKVIRDIQQETGASGEIIRAAQQDLMQHTTSWKGTHSERSLQDAMGRYSVSSDRVKGAFRALVMQKLDAIKSPLEKNQAQVDAFFEKKPEYKEILPFLGRRQWLPRQGLQTFEEALSTRELTSEDKKSIASTFKHAMTQMRMHNAQIESFFSPMGDAYYIDADTKHLVRKAYEELLEHDHVWDGSGQKIPLGQALFSDTLDMATVETLFKLKLEGQIFDYNYNFLNQLILQSEHHQTEANQIRKQAQWIPGGKVESLGEALLRRPITAELLDRIRTLLLDLHRTGKDRLEAEKTHYEVLGVDSGADSTAIKKAFMKISLKCHPDKTKDEAEHQKFKEASEAYQVLIDPKEREEYNQLMGLTR